MKYSYSGNGSRNRQLPHFKNNRKAIKLDRALFVRKAQATGQNEYKVESTFDDFAISANLKSAIASVGFTKPTPIQDQCIPYILSGRDVIGVADTGTGKSAAFLIPLIENVCKDRSKKVLIITPTRELSVQIESELEKFSRSLEISSVSCIGGEYIRRQKERLRRKPHFVIGTPGRLLDLESQNAINFQEYTSIVLDEVDRMLDMGFVRSIKHIISQLPQSRQSLFFSATVPNKMDALMRSFLKNPIKVTVAANSPSVHVHQDIVQFSPNNKLSLLEDLLSQDDVLKAIVFGRTKWGIKKLARHLGSKGYKIAEIHGNRSQSQRRAALKKFRSNTVSVLLATDVAARGIDVENITHVINYDAPESYDDYIHRIGRTGRAGQKGTALTFVETQ